MDELVEKERSKIRKRAAEEYDKKAASPGDAGSALRGRAGHPMLIRPTGLYTGMEYTGTEAGMNPATSMMPGRTLSSQSRPSPVSPMLSLKPPVVEIASQSLDVAPHSSSQASSSSASFSTVRTSLVKGPSTAVAIYPDRKAHASPSDMSGTSVRKDKPTMKYKARGDNQYGMKVAADPM